MELGEADPLPGSTSFRKIELGAAAEVEGMARCPGASHVVDNVSIEREQLADLPETEIDARTKLQVFGEERTELREEADVYDLRVQSKSALKADVKLLGVLFYGTLRIAN